MLKENRNAKMTNNNTITTKNTTTIQLQRLQEGKTYVCTEKRGHEDDAERT
jgi:hypothetical protein